MKEQNEEVATKPSRPVSAFPSPTHSLHYLKSVSQVMMTVIIIMIIASSFYNVSTYALSHFILSHNNSVGWWITGCYLHFLVRKLKLRKVIWLAQMHTSNQCVEEDLNTPHDSRFRESSYHFMLPGIQFCLLYFWIFSTRFYSSNMESGDIPDLPFGYLYTWKVMLPGGPISRCRASALIWAIILYLYHSAHSTERTQSSSCFYLYQKSTTVSLK